MSIDHLHPETLGALVDGELASQEATAAQSHLNECLDCSKTALGLMQLRSATKLAALCNTPSPEVMARLRAGTRRVEVPRSRSARPRAVMLQIAAALAVIALALGGWKWTRQSDSLAAEVLDQHLTTLTAASQPEVLSSDRHTVKPWFEGKLPFSFNLPEPNALPPDTVLNGADFVYVQGRPTALLRFMIHKHHVSVFVCQAGIVPDLLGRKTRSGFQFAEAKSSGLEYLGVSDVNAGEVDGLVRSLTAAH